MGRASLTCNGTSSYVDCGDGVPTDGWPEGDYSFTLDINIVDGQPALAATPRIFGDNSGYNGKGAIYSVLQHDGQTNPGGVTLVLRYNDVYAIANTESGIFPNGQTGWYNLGYRVDWSNDKMDIFVNGVKQTLKTAQAGDISGLTKTDWVEPNAGSGQTLSAAFHTTYKNWLASNVVNFRRYTRALTDAEFAMIAVGKLSAVIDYEEAAAPFGRLVDLTGTYTVTANATTESPDGPGVFF